MTSSNGEVLAKIKSKTCAWCARGLHEQCGNLYRHKPDAAVPQTWRWWCGCVKPHCPGKSARPKRGSKR